MAAPSTRDTVQDLVTSYEKTHSGITISQTYAGSKIVQSEVTQGAQIDVVILSSDVGSKISSLFDEKRSLYKDHTTIAISNGAAAKINDPKDLGKPGVRIGAGSPNSVTEEFEYATVLKLANHIGQDFPKKYHANILSVRTDSLKLLDLLKANQIDAVIVFSSLIDASKMKEISIPSDSQVSVEYVSGALKSS